MANGRILLDIAELDGPIYAFHHGLQSDFEVLKAQAGLLICSFFVDQKTGHKRQITKGKNTILVKPKTWV